MQMLYCIDYQVNFKRRYNFGNAALRYRYLVRNRDYWSEIIESEMNGFKLVSDSNFD